MMERWPRASIALTVSTPTGLALAHGQAPVPVLWFPLDHPRTVRLFFDDLRPRALILIETELWPIVLATAHARCIPVALVNGRLSDSRAAAYRRAAALWRPVVRPFAAAAMQTAAYADRIAGLGLDRARITVTGNIKYDAVPAASSPEERTALRAELGIAPDAPVIVFGSTRDGDEALAARCYAHLRDHVPGLRFVIAPRHLDRVSVAQQALSGVPHVLRSSLHGAADRSAPVIILDTHGELRRVYGLATIAVVCGSFYPGVNGHNPIEPAAQGVATIYGPYMGNFGDITAQLLATGGAMQVSSADVLADALASLLSDGARRCALGEAGRSVVIENQGALQRTRDVLAPLVERTLRD